MKANPETCQLWKSSSDELSICVDNYNIKSSRCEKLLGIKIHNKLNFNTYVDEIYKEVGQKLKTIFSQENGYKEMKSPLKLNYQKKSNHKL